MSDNYLKIAPSQVDYVPNAESVRQSTVLLKSLLPTADAVTFHQWNGIQFIDQGCFFERVSCPACGEVLDMDWWHERMSSKWNDVPKRFETLDIQTPCCGFETSLNDLKYEWPAAFGLCILEVVNPGRDLSDEELLRIQATFGCPVRKVLARY